jgi:hypothetical protein
MDGASFIGVSLHAWFEVGKSSIAKYVVTALPEVHTEARALREAAGLSATPAS